MSLALTACVVDAPDVSTSESLASSSIVPEKEMVITDKSVIASPLETTYDAAHPSGSTRSGAWTFGRLVHNMLPAAERDSEAAASRFVLRWLATWESLQAPNAEVTPAQPRASVRLMITNPWKAASGCADPASPATDDTCVLDMSKAPFRLMAIVYRPDLRIVAGDDRSSGGEGRFVFEVIGPTLALDASGAVAVMDPTPKAQKFTVIFEYSLPVNNDVQIINWAQKWHKLGSKPWGEAYNAQLATITHEFSGPDQDSRRPNGNALDQLRTNEVALNGARFPSDGFTAGKQFWELREFHLTTTGLAPHTMNLEPARDFDIPRPTFKDREGTRTSELVSFLDANAADVLKATHVIPPAMSANSSLVGSSPYGAWGKLTATSPGAAHDLGDVAIDVRDSFALNTCAGCHRHETDTRHFMHVSFVGALEPMSKVDDRARIGMATAPDDAVALSNFLRAEISPGGDRYEDYAQLLVTKRVDLKNKPGLRACQ